MVELRVINEENYEECLALNSNIECERFVDSVAYSLAEAWVFYADMKPFAIYNDDDMIGFVSMYVGDDNPQIINFFIVDSFRDRGFGTRAVEVCIHYLRTVHKASKLSVPVELNNKAAQKFWRKLGFSTSNNIEDGYVFMRLNL